MPSKPSKTLSFNSPRPIVTSATPVRMPRSDKSGRVTAPGPLHLDCKRKRSRSAKRHREGSPLRVTVDSPFFTLGTTVRAVQRRAPMTIIAARGCPATRLLALEIS
jgi:hypothetical protein